jgi:hypothetical protein
MALYCEVITSRMISIVGNEKKVTYHLIIEENTVAFLLNVGGEEELNINFVLSSDKSVNIKCMNTNNYRGYKFGYMLMRLVCEYLLFDRNVNSNTLITLDDMSDNFRKGPKNIYCNVGFLYVDDVGPEMNGILQVVYLNCLEKTRPF